MRPWCRGPRNRSHPTAGFPDPRRGVSHRSAPACCSQPREAVGPLSSHPSRSRKEHHVLKSLLFGFVAVDLLMILGLVYFAVAHDGGLPAWIMVAIWAVALVLVPAVALRGRVR